MMKRRCDTGALVLSVVLVVSAMGASLAGDVLRERAEEKEEMIGDQNSSGEGDVIVARSQGNFEEPEQEESEEHSRRSEAETEEETAAPPKLTEAARKDGQETTAAGAGGDAIVSPSAKVIIWDESVDLATIDPNQQDNASAAGGGGVRERKEPPPSQERYSDVETSEKKEGEAGARGESQIVSEGRSHANSASSSLSSSFIWKTALFAFFGSAVLLFMMNDLDSTSKQQIYNRCSNPQCNRSEEMSGREQFTCQLTRHSSASKGMLPPWQFRIAEDL